MNIENSLAFSAISPNSGSIQGTILTLNVNGTPDGGDEEDDAIVELREARPDKNPSNEKFFCEVLSQSHSRITCLTPQFPDSSDKKDYEIVITVQER